MIRRATVLLLLGAVLGSCTGQQSSLDAQSPEAERLEQLFWIFTGVSLLVWVAVVVALVLALLRTRRPAEASTPQSERRLLQVVSVATVLTAVTLIALTLLSYRAQGDLFGSGEEGITTIRLTGHQWWWEARYESEEPSQVFTTANELHVPVGRRIRVKLATSDVIHSFWVPQLFGKMDLVNGVENEVRFTVNRAGTFRGQCAEFCGAQHAHMGLLVIAQSEDDFRRWRAEQVASAAPPASEPGRQVFLSKPCATCHTIRGTPAGGRVGPDLTHFASRQQLASATLPMTREAIGAWIVDPQSIKPGVRMPAVEFAGDELPQLLDYLEGLK